MPISKKLKMLIPEIKSQFPEVIDLLNIRNSTKKESVIALAKKARRGNIAARNLIIEKLIPLIICHVYVICKRFGKLNEFEDKIYDAIIYLCEHINARGENKGFYEGIYKHVFRDIKYDLLYSNIGEYHNIPVFRRDMIDQLFSACPGSNPSRAEIFEILFPIKYAEYCHQEYFKDNIFYDWMYFQSGLLDEILNMWDDIDNHTEDTNLIYDDSDMITNSFLSEELSVALNKLTPREAMVLIYRFGLSNKCYERAIDEYCHEYNVKEKIIVDIPHTLEETGELLDIAKERVRQIEAKALRKLRHPSRGLPLVDFAIDAFGDDGHLQAMLDADAEWQQRIDSLANNLRKTVRGYEYE